MLIEAQHDLGIPTWQDLSDLDHGHTEQLLRDALADESTANALCLITPDIESSSVIARTELPAIMRRIERRDGFFMVPVAAGGIGYADVPRVVGTYIGLHNLAEWNIHKAETDPLSTIDAFEIARLIVKQRMIGIVRQLAPHAPLRLVLNTRKKPAFVPGVALTLDWTHRFDGRMAQPPETWTRHLLPALESVAQACETQAPGHSIVAEGLCSLPAAVALGTTFLATRRLSIAWQQVSPKRGPQLWSLAASRETSAFFCNILPADPSGDDLALIVSVTSSVDPAFAALRPSLPKFRGLVVVAKSGDYPHDIATAGQAVDVVQLILEGLRRARADLQPRGTVHLFLAVPAGLAMMIGQVLNTFGPVQTYEHIGTDAVGTYHPAAVLHPSS